MNTCCLTGFAWSGKPTGTETTLASLPTYKAGNNPKHAILILHDALGWQFNNTRLLADHYAAEANATVYLPDFFGGWAVGENDVSIRVTDGKVEMVQNPDFDWKAWFARNGDRFGDVTACAKELRGKYEFVGAVGFCWGGSMGFKLAAKELALVDCVTIAHPGPPSEEDVRAVGVPVQIIAPEFDPTFTQEKKDLCNSVIPTLGIEYVYNYFPGRVHGFCTKCDEKNEDERKALERAKDAVVWWFLTHQPKK